MSDFQVMSSVFKTYPKERVLDWADQKAAEIAENFIQINGHFNWHLPDFDWYSLNKMIAAALRER